MSDLTRHRCPDDETLACFVAASLASAEHQAVAAHLAACARCAASAGLAARVLDRRELPFPAVPRWAAAPLALAAVLALAAGVAVLRSRSRPVIAPPAALAHAGKVLGSARPQALVPHLWRAGDPALAFAPGAAGDSVTLFRLGRESLDLAVAIEARHEESIRHSLRVVADLLASRTGPDSRALSRRLEALSGGSAAAWNASLATEVLALPGLAGDAYFDGGAFVEAARLRALGGDRGVLAEPFPEAFRRRALASDARPGLARAFARIDSALAESERSDVALERLEGALTQLLLLH